MIPCPCHLHSGTFLHKPEKNLNTLLLYCMMQLDCEGAQLSVCVLSLHGSEILKISYYINLRDVCGEELNTTVLNNGKTIDFHLVSIATNVKLRAIDRGL